MIIIVKYCKVKSVFIVKHCKGFSKFIVKLEENRAFSLNISLFTKMSGFLPKDERLKALAGAA